jgi:hypothetical protein
MKRMLLALAATTILSSPAFATKIGVSMDKFDDNFPDRPAQRNG